MVRVVESVDQVASAAADLVGAQLCRDRRTRLGVATGATPLPLYRELARRHAAGDLPAGELTLFLLDEYLGLGTDDPRSFRAVVVDHLARPLGIPDGAVHAPEVGAADLQQACRRFDALRDDAGIDLQILGIGRNGHIAFNEPGSAPDSGCRVVQLTDVTRSDNGLGPKDPTHAVTVGIGSILRARRLLLLATGPTKAEALARAVHADPRSPAGALSGHPDLTIIADRDAAALLGPAPTPTDGAT